MPHCWDYRVRFNISSGITVLTSIFIAQPLYIFILALIVVTFIPKCAPFCVHLRNVICGLTEGDPGYKEFIGGTFLISGNHALNYGRLADDSTRESTTTVFSSNQGDGAYSVPLQNGVDEDEDGYSNNGV